MLKIVRGSVTKRQRWAGRVISALAALFLLLDAVGKLIKPAPVVEGTVRLGYSEGVIVPNGIILGICTVLYLIPRTAVLGSILLTGYLGGAVATHVRAGDPAFPVVLPVMLGMLLWVGHWLRDPRLRSLVPFTAPPAATSAEQVNRRYTCLFRRQGGGTEENVGQKSGELSVL
jgi:hypothetical protein